MDKKDDMAFPCNEFNSMSLRDWYAGMALQGLCANRKFLDEHLNDCISQEIEDPDMIRGLFANTCYLFADAMIREKNHE